MEEGSEPDAERIDASGWTARRYAHVVEAPRHQPALLQEVLAALDPRPGETALDCTVGQGGHAEAIAKRIGPAGTLVINDVDPTQLGYASQRIGGLPAAPRLIELRGSFAEAPRRLAEMDLAADVVLADLGFSSAQMDDPARGLSFTRDGPLDMRMDPSAPTTAAELVNTMSEQELAEIVRDFGEERAWRRIARKLVEARSKQPITTTARLAEVVRSAVGGRRGAGRIDPATRTFQALRIAVNDELGALDALLEAIGRAAVTLAGAGRAWLTPGARLAIVSFHSLEDRRVKRAFAGLAERGLAARLTRGPITTSAEKRRDNPRARSAKMRAIRVGPIAAEHCGARNAPTDNQPGANTDGEPP